MLEIPDILGGGREPTYEEKMRVPPPPRVYRLLRALPVEAELGLHKMQLILLRISKLDSI